MTGCTKLSHVYIHLASAGDLDACNAVRTDLRSLLKALDEHDDIRGYRMSLIVDQDVGGCAQGPAPTDAVCRIDNL